MSNHELRVVANATAVDQGDTDFFDATGLQVELVRAMGRSMQAFVGSPRTARGTRGRRTLSIGPLYESQNGRVVQAGALVLASGLVGPRPFWELLQRIARRADWLRATFALASRPRCHGVARADGAALVVGFSGIWQAAPSLTLVVAGGGIGERVLEAEVRSCLVVAAGAADGDDPFPPWQPGDPTRAILCEEAC